MAIGLDNGNVNIWRIDSKVPCIGSNDFNKILSRQKEAEKDSPPEEYVKLNDLAPYRILKIGQSMRITHVRLVCNSSFLLFFLEEDLLINWFIFITC